MLRHLPNALCVFRIVLVAPVLWAITEGEYVLALMLFVTAGFTDAIDGFLARQFDWRTQLGALLDPFADKLLMVSVLVWLTLGGLIPFWLAAVLIGRDLVIVGGVIFYRVTIGPFSGGASGVSKLNTAMQLLFVTAVLAQAAFAVPNASVVSILGSLVFVTAVVSGLHYVRVGSMMALNVRRTT